MEEEKEEDTQKRAEHILLCTPHCSHCIYPGREVGSSCAPESLLLSTITMTNFNTNLKIIQY